MSYDARYVEQSHQYVCQVEISAGFKKKTIFLLTEISHSRKHSVVMTVFFMVKG